MRRRFGKKCKQLTMREEQRKEVALFQQLLTLNKMRGIDEEAAIERYSKDYVKSKEDATKDIRNIIFKKIKRELMDAISL
ncbi:Oidioi.mRNA.OKI2018_I69.XSR.g15359.t1.cds [Oikopleura dioica]|uniref:Oidioi.mRNA.OKI2018_I69.XSR.g15359.t1.cds n=1 Tax=Oikopleura dioica TaxID=34765 RepID=A0ABN7SHR6_OIKDI|nr:Oidioi.mRNA.OKI2018_I69.XSR.g15359.t1.cds [Oikopleura dioica]